MNSRFDALFTLRIFRLCAQTCSANAPRPAHISASLPGLPATLVACVLLATGALARDNAGASTGQTDALMNLDFEKLLNVEISAASKFAQRASEAPSAVTVVTADDIRAYGYRTFADILKSIRGLHVTYDRNYSYLGVRGLARPGDYNTRVLLLVDGYRVSDNIYDQAPVGTEFPIDVDLIRQVEFIPGPGSSVYGSGAFLGVINVRTKDGSDFEHAEIKGEVASAKTVRGRVSGGRTFDNGGKLLLSASGMSSEGRNLFFPEFNSPETNNGVAEGLDYERARSFFGKATSEDWTVELSHSERSKGIPTASFGQTFNDPRSRTKDRRTFLSAGYAHTWSDHDLVARLSYTDWSYAGVYSYGLPPAGANFDGAKGQWWDAELQFGTRIFENHHLIAGVDYHLDDKQIQTNFTEDLLVDSLNDRRSGYRYGVYLQDEITLTPQWLLNAGVRYDDYHTDGRKSVNPRLAAIYKPRDTTSLKVLYGTAFRSPNAYELHFSNSEQKINPDLHAEKIRTFEFVVEERRPQGLRLSGSVFHYDIKDMISLTTDAADGLVVFANIDKVKTNGAEFEVERLWDAGTRLRASITWQRAEDGTTGRQLTNSASILGKLNFTMPVLRGWANAGIEGQYTGSRLTIGDNHVGPYAIVNLTLLTRRIASGLEVSASVYNLFDKRYGDPGSEEHVQDVIQQDGRILRVSASYRF
jgi:outer membrane receptor protein involved in Fe transport